MPRIPFRTAVAVFAALLAAACDDGVQPPLPPSLAVAPQSRTLQVGETHQFTATVTDPANRLDASAVVWSSVDETVATVSSAGLVTGVRPGTTRIVAAAGTATDTTQVQVVRTPASITLDGPATLSPGDVVQLSATVVDTDGEVMAGPIEWSVSAADVATVDGQGRLSALKEGSVVVTADAPPAAASLEVEVRTAPPPPGCGVEAIQLEVGEVRRYQGGAPLSLCLSGGAEYTLIAANASSASLVTDFAGSGLSASAPALAPGLAPSRSVQTIAAGGATLDREFERRLRRQERERFSPAGARSRVLARSLQTIPTARAVGDLMELNTSTSCEDPEARTGRVQYVGERAIIVADTANPAGLSASDYARFGMVYDTLLYPVVTEHFGEPVGVNGETRAVIFYTRAVNQLTPRDSEGVVGGFFWAGDLFPRASCAGSNERGMFYMLAPDPEGEINGNVRSIAYVERATASTIAHELQHFINASRRIFVNDADVWEESWLNEGLSHIAEELVFYERSGLSPRRNLGPTQLGSTQSQLDITNRYAISNLLRMDRYLRDVERQGPFQDDDDLATRGASWQFLRYAMDRHGGDARVLLSSLVDSRTAGLTNLEVVLGIDPRAWFVDDAVTLYADDEVSGTAVEHRHPSWNFRTLLEWINSDGFVLSTRQLRDTEAISVRIEGWGTSYVRASVASGRVGNVRVGRTDKLPAASLRFVLMRTR